jgi:hypothetical protein
LQRAFRAARAKVAGLPAGFRFHDLRHYYASLLITSGADVKVVQARLRHASAKTTLDTYAHLLPDSDDSTRAAVDKVLAARVAEIPEHPGFPGTGGGGEADNALVSGQFVTTRRSRARTPQASLAVVGGG